MRPFSKWELLLKEFAPRGSEFLLLRANPYGMENHFYNNMRPPFNVTILLRICVTVSWELRQWS